MLVEFVEAVTRKLCIYFRGGNLNLSIDKLESKNTFTA